MMWLWLGPAIYLFGTAVTMFGIGLIMGIEDRDWDREHEHISDTPSLAIMAVFWPLTLVYVMWRSPYVIGNSMGKALRARGETKRMKDAEIDSIRKEIEAKIRRGEAA